jgi:hypothetical protein
MKLNAPRKFITRVTGVSKSYLDQVVTGTGTSVLTDEKKALIKEAEAKWHFISYIVEIATYAAKNGNLANIKKAIKDAL